MRKIVYNNKLKKLLISILVVMMLMSYVRPIRVFATKEEEYEWKSYTDWIKKPNKEDVVNTATRLYFEGLPEYIEAYNDEQRSKKINEILEKPDNLFLKAKYIKDGGFLWFDEFKIISHKIVDENNEEKNEYKKNYQDLISWSGKKSSELDPVIIDAIKRQLYPGDSELTGGTDKEDIAEMVLELNKATIMFTIYGTTSDFEIISFEVQGKTNEELAIEAGKELGVKTSDNKTPVAGGTKFEYADGNYTATGTIRGIVQSMRKKYEDLEHGKSIATVMGRMASDQELTDFETKVKAEILKYLNDNSLIASDEDADAIVNQIYNYHKNNSAITVEVGGSYNLETPGDGATCEVKSVQITLTEDNVKEAISAGDVDGVDLSPKKVDKYGRELDVAIDSSGRILTEEEEDGAGIGGILLEPIFSLINFVADAIISWVGEFMIGQDGLEGYISIESVKPENVESLTKDDVYRVSTKSFINLLGTHYYEVRYTPEKIFSGEVPILSIDFISGNDAKGNKIDGDWQNIREVISAWYKVLRMIAIIGLLSVLIYTGIKIIISANAKDKAKYKEWIINWFLAVAILFSMHYIMSFIISVTNEISQLLTQSCQEIIVEEIPTINQKHKTDVASDKVFTTNLMGLVRYMIQGDNWKQKIGYEVIYIALIVHTVKFTMIYLKRVLNMAFLTLIAPIVALTYPIDKINDGKAQGFDMWLKEYIFNALLQPMHMILYYILVGSSVNIAASNPLYGIVVLMFMTEAEKLLKKIFGFDKAGGGTVGGMAGAFAAGAIASNIKNIARMAKLPGGNGGKSGSDGKVEDYLKDPKPTDTDDNENLWLNGNSGGNNNVGGNNNEDDDNREIDEDAIMDNTTLAEGDWDHDGSSDKNFRKPGESEEDESQVPVQPISSDEDEDDDEIDEDAILANTTLADDVEEQQTPPLPPPPPSSPKGQNDNNTKLNNDGTSASASDDSSQEQTSDDKWKRRMNGWKNVGKTLIKPAWDLDKPLKYRMKKVGKAALRGGVGAALGIGAAAVQAGISITDGKYNPMEGVATFSAGYAGGGQISRGVGSLIDTYREGRDEGQKDEIMKRAKEKWGQREDVIAYNKKKYDEKDRQRVLEIQKKLLEQGITDTGEMHKCIKYIKSINNGKIEGATDDMIRKSRVLHDFRKEMSDQGVNIYEDKKRNEYINSVAKTEKDKQILRAKFKAAVDYDKAQK